MKIKKCKLCEEQNNRLKSEFCSEYCKTKYWRIINAEHSQQFNKQYYEQHKNRYSEKNREKYRLNKNLYNIKSNIYAKANPDKRCALANKYNAIKLNATPKWLTKEQFKEIESFYTQAKELQLQTNIKYHVDHIIPLQGETVSGLHVPWNLQVITAEENLKKGNKLIKVYYE